MSTACLSAEALTAQENCRTPRVGPECFGLGMINIINREIRERTIDSRVRRMRLKLTVNILRMTTYEANVRTGTK